MGERREAKKTPVAAPDMLAAMTDAWRRYLGSEPKPEAIRLVVAQWALETGWGRSMVQFNVGNVKAPSTDGDYDYCYFTTWEVLPTAEAEAEVRANPRTAQIVKLTNEGRKAHLAVYPDHPWCRFKAFASLADGCVDHLALIRARFSQSWPALCSGSPREYAIALKAQRYYTAEVEEYARAISGVFDMLSRIESAPTSSAPIAPREDAFVKAPLSSEAADEFMGRTSG